MLGREGCCFVVVSVVLGVLCGLGSNFMCLLFVGKCECVVRWSVIVFLPVSVC